MFCFIYLIEKCQVLFFPPKSKTKDLHPPPFKNKGVTAVWPLRIHSKFAFFSHFPPLFPPFSQRTSSITLPHFSPFQRPPITQNAPQRSSTQNRELRTVNCELPHRVLSSPQRVSMQKPASNQMLALSGSRRWSRSRARSICPRKHLRVLPQRTRPSLFASD